MDAATIITIASSIVGVGIALGGGIWETRNSVGRLEVSLNTKIATIKSDCDKNISEVKENLERQSTMIEPFWQALCDNLPLILKMHNSPDPLAAVLKGEATPEEADSLIERIQKELQETISKGDDIKAYGYIMALAMVKAKRKKLEK